MTIAALTACGQAGKSGLAAAPLPEGSIQTGAALYMVPLAVRDADGCQGYRQYSPIHVVTMAIYYRRVARDGGKGFTANKLQADCRAGGKKE